jgi:drug/metabolite transporter (DMT)-like permease
VKVIGILLIVFGLVGLLVGGIGYTKREKVLDIGPLQASTEKHKEIPISPIAGVVAIAAGAILLATGTKTGA